MNSKNLRSTGGMVVTKIVFLCFRNTVCGYSLVSLIHTWGDSEETLIHLWAKFSRTSRYVVGAIVVFFAMYILTESFVRSYGPTGCGCGIANCYRSLRVSIGRVVKSIR